MGTDEEARVRESSCTLHSNPAPALASSGIRAVNLDPVWGGINHRPSPQQGLDILEDSFTLPLANPLPPSTSGFASASLGHIKGLAAEYVDHKKQGRMGYDADWLTGMACEAYLRAVKTFGHLPIFRQYCSRPQLMHHTVEEIGRFMEYLGRDLPVLWFLPEAMNTDHYLGLGLAPWPIVRDPDFSKTATGDPHGDKRRLSDEEETNDIRKARGGYWVLWKPRRLLMSSRATISEQIWLKNRLALDLGASTKDLVLGDLAEQGALWVQAWREGLVSNTDFQAVRTVTCYRSALLQGDYFRPIDISFGIGYSRQGLSITDFGNQARVTGLGISPFLI